MAGFDSSEQQKRQSSNVLNFTRPVNGIVVEQRVRDGFINGTAMCVAHSKDVSDWLALDSTLRLVAALARRLDLLPNSEISPNSVKTRVSATYPALVTVRRGSPENGGGTWIHPKLGVHLAQWCNEDFALLVSDWIEEWMTTGRNPVQPSWDQQYTAWQQRHDIRVFLKDFLRPELMDAVVSWAQTHGGSPRRLAAAVHDAMNERIQGMKSQEIRALNGLPLSSLIRDYFEAPPLVGYAAINKLAKNAIEDRGIEPIQAVHEACDSYLGLNYAPPPVQIAENLYSQGRRLRSAKSRKKLAQSHQLTLWDAVS